MTVLSLTWESPYLGIKDRLYIETGPRCHHGNEAETPDEYEHDIQ